MLNMKKALIAGAVLTAFAASAFAAEAQDTNKPFNCDRNKATCEKQGPGHFQRREMRGFPQRPPMTQEQREAFKNMSPAERKDFMKKRNAEWVKSMTPEQKANYEQHKKMMKERREAHQKLVKEKMSKLTPEQKAEVTQFIKDDMAQRKAMGERLKKMTPEQREALRVMRPGRNHRMGPMHGPQGFGPKGHGPQGPGPEGFRPQGPGPQGPAPQQDVK